MTENISSLNNLALKVQEFIYQRNEVVRKQEVQVFPDTELIDSRLIDSLTFVEFLLFLEDHFNCEINATAGDIDVFRSVERIHKHFAQT
ncbi:acyl carrier protein [bacterium]|nr:acyl carrier protein [bacterium]